MPSAPQMFDRRQVCRVVGASAAQLRGWEKQELVPRLEQYALSDLVALHVLARLRKARVPGSEVRRAVGALRHKLAHVENPLRDLKIVVEGRHIAVIVDGCRMEPVSGQLLFDFDAAELNRLMAFPGKANDKAKKLQESEAWFQKGLELEQTGAPLEEIIEAYTRAIELDPGSAGALVNLGTIHYHLRQWEKAEKWYRQALTADPTYALAHFNLGNLYDEKGRKDLALEHYQDAIRLNPRYADAHYNLALLHQANGEVMTAVRHWKTYLKLDGGSSWAVIARRELEKLTRATLVQGTRKQDHSLGIVS